MMKRHVLAMAVNVLGIVLGMIALHGNLGRQMDLPGIASPCNLLLDYVKIFENSCHIFIPATLSR